MGIDPKLSPLPQDMEELRQFSDITVLRAPILGGHIGFVSQYVYE